MQEVNTAVDEYTDNFRSHCNLVYSSDIEKGIYKTL